MVDATTSNALLTVPARGADPGTWDIPVNGNTTALDGFLCGVATVTLSNANLSLTAPTGIVTPSGGPFQSQNRIIKFTGALTGNVQVTLPLPGEYTIQNLTTGNFVVSFVAVGAGKVVATPQGSVMNIWNDGTDVWLVKNRTPGELIFLGGAIGLPGWMAACSVSPYLVCDGSIYSAAVYPALTSIYGSTFGGNGTTTFGVQDLQGRVPIAYDGTGTRITAAGSGINGQLLGSAGGTQSIALTLSQLPTGITSNGSMTTAQGLVLFASGGTGFGITEFSAPSGPTVWQAFSTGAALSQAVATVSGSVTSNNTSGVGHFNVQPAQMAGIWMVAT